MTCTMLFISHQPSNPLNLPQRILFLPRQQQQPPPPLLLPQAVLLPNRTIWKQPLTVTSEHPDALQLQVFVRQGIC